MSGVDLEGVKKRFGSVEVVFGVDIKIEPGEFCVIVGPSGCGKSTLLRMIAGLETISDGEVRIGGARVNDIEPAGRGVAMVFQSYALYPHMTVEQNMSFGLRMNGRDRADVAQRVEAAARILQIEDLMQRKPGQLSGGQRQRVAIGRAIVRNPQVFLFDEPLSNLDAELRVAMRLELAKLHRELSGPTMIYVTHDQVEAMTLADRIVVLRRGRVEQVGPPIELYQQPANRFVAGFIGTPQMNFFDIGIEPGSEGPLARLALGGQARVAVADATDPQRAATLGLRASQLRVTAPEKGTLRGEVSVLERLGDLDYLYVQIGDAEHVARLDTGHDLKPGDQVGLEFAGPGHFFDKDGVSLPALSIRPEDRAQP